MSSGEVFKLRTNLDYEVKEHDIAKYHSIIQNILTPQDLFKVINHFSSAVLEYEYHVASSWERNELHEYLDHLESIRAIIQANEEAAFMRLGAGKMMHYQTIAMALFHQWGKDEEDKEWLKYLDICNAFEDEEVDDPYPVSRELTVTDQMPLGWVKLSIKK